jgi:hypothetical protein
MLRRLGDLGIQLNNPLPYPPLPQDPNQPIHTPWETPPFDLLPMAPRQVDRVNDKFHLSVARRNPLDLPPGPPPLSPQGVASLSLDSTR